MSNSNKALKMSYREVPETCPSVEEAFAVAEERVKNVLTPYEVHW